MRIFICSPYRGKVSRNLRYAKAICEAIINAGHTPFAPHLYYPQLLISDEKGRELALKDLAECEAMIVCDLYGVSAGMEAEIDEAKRLNIKTIFAKSAKELDKWKTND
ncbi:MAG: hypothetical protein LBF86_01965 [Helicobacteraceae bacterium]|jgi:hypothetical protein|nr:hypothetical protein [Helicobacteraceae bacterium]